MLINKLAMGICKRLLEQDQRRAEERQQLLMEKKRFENAKKLLDDIYAREY